NAASISPTCACSDRVSTSCAPSTGSLRASSATSASSRADSACSLARPGSTAGVLARVCPATAGGSSRAAGEDRGCAADVVAGALVAMASVATGASRPSDEGSTVGGSAWLPAATSAGVPSGVPWRTSNSSGSAASSAVHAAIAQGRIRCVRRGAGASRGAIRCQASTGGASSGSAENASLQLRGSGCRSVISMLLDLQQRTQAAGAARQLGFGETRRALHQRGDLLMGVALGVVQPQHAAGRVGQCGQRALQRGRIRGGGRRGRGVLHVVAIQRQ